MSMVDSNVSRELNNLNSMELAKLYKNNQELFKKYCVKNKKSIVTLKPTIMIFMVVVFVQRP